MNVAMSKRLAVAVVVMIVIVFSSESILALLRHWTIDVETQVTDAAGLAVTPDATVDASVTATPGPTPTPQPFTSLKPDQHLNVDVTWDYRIGPRFPLTVVHADVLRESDDAIVSTTCKWADGGHFLVRDFSIQTKGKAVLSGTQRIGWDPLKKQFKTWIFDSEGGHAEGYWTRNGDQWTIKLEGVRQDGGHRQRGCADLASMVCWCQPYRMSRRKNVTRKPARNANAAAVAALTTLKASNQWDLYWRNQCGTKT